MSFLSLFLWISFYGFYGRVRTFNARDTRATLPHLKKLYYAASHIGTSIAAVMVHFSQARDRHSGVASVE